LEEVQSHEESECALMKYCQGPLCHTYQTKDRKRGPKGAKVYKKDDGSENIFEGILITQEEIDNFNDEYPEEDLKEHPLYSVDQAASALGHLKPADVTIGQWKQDPRVVAQSLRILKRKLAKAEIENDPDYFKS